MMILSLICLLVSVVLLIFASTFRPSKYPPGPQFLPFLGNLLHYKKWLNLLGYHHLVWLKLAKDYGPVVGLKLGRNLIVTVSGPELVKEVLTREEFDGRPDGFFFRLRTFGKRLGIVFIDGQFWKKQRKFSLQHLKNFGLGKREMEEKVHEECLALNELFRKKCSEPIFMHNAFDVSVLNALWSMLAGQRFDIEDERLTTLLKIIHDCFRVVDMTGGVINQMPFLRYVAPSASGYNQILDVLTRMWKFLEDTIEEHRQTRHLTEPRDLIDAFLNSMAINVDESFTDDQLLSLCLDLFMAGAETTSNSLGFAAMYMVLYPDIQKKVQEEMDDQVGRNRWPTLKDRMNLKYTQAVLLELHRRANLAPMGIAHRAIKNTQLMGYTIPKDTIVLANLYSVHMDDTFWENPNEFRPERFLDKTGNVVVNEAHYMPFGLGKRRCLGEVLGKTNMFLFFTSLLHNFYLEPVNESYPEPDPFDGVTLAPKPFKGKLIPRDD